MKKIGFIALFLLGVISIHAQKITKGSFCDLANVKMVNISIDYKESKIDRMPFEAFLETEEKWEEAYKDIMLKLIKSANQNSGGIVYTSKQTTDYQLIFKAIIVDRDGETSGNLLLLDKDGNVIGEAEKFNANGGHFGSQTNLMGDASERLGKKIAQFIKKQIK
jgi:hypothetical protein